MRRFRGFILAVMFFFMVNPSMAFMPKLEKLHQAIADGNRRSHREQGLRIEVELFLGGEDPVARGILESHYSGLARLELRSMEGANIERHLLRGSEYLATRNAQLLDEPRPFLPPLFLLQSGTNDAVLSNLKNFGVDVQRVDLGDLQGRDCYVLGGRTAGVPEFSPEKFEGPSVWIDLNTYLLLLAQDSAGAVYRFGPPRTFGALQFPAWIQVEGPVSARLEFQSISPVKLSPETFQESWLYSPSSPPSPQGASS